MPEDKRNEPLVEGNPGGTAGTGDTETTGSGAGAGAAGPAESAVGRGRQDDTGRLVEGAHHSGDPAGRDGGSAISSGAPQDEAGLTGSGLSDQGDFERETPGGSDTIAGADAIGSRSPDAGDPGGMGGVRAGPDTHGRPPGGVSPMAGHGGEDEEAPGDGRPRAD